MHRLAVVPVNGTVVAKNRDRHVCYLLTSVHTSKQAIDGELRLCLDKGFEESRERCDDYGYRSRRGKNGVGEEGGSRREYIECERMDWTVEILLGMSTWRNLLGHDGGWAAACLD